MIKYIKENWQGLLISILFALLVGIVSSLLSGSVKSTYDSLIKPPLSPPNWLFGIIWPILYTLMGTAAYIIYKSDVEESEKRKALKLYLIQLFFNFTWSIVFFRFNLLWGAFINILLLDFFVILTILSFKRINKTAALLMYPYLLWILIATYLNGGIALLN